MRFLSVFTLIACSLVGALLSQLIGCENPTNSDISTFSGKKKVENQGPAKVIRRKGLQIVDGETIIGKSAEHFRYNFSEFSMAPLTKGLNDLLLKTSSYLKDHPNRVLNIEGLCTGEEKNVSALPSLGLARANTLKEILIAFGASGEQIVCSSKVVELLSVRQGFAYGPIQLIFTEKTDGGIDRIGLERELRKNAPTIYFNNGEVILNRELRQYIADLLFYLDVTPKATVTLIGHTNDKKNPGRSREIGQKRADVVMDYLVKNGIERRQVTATTKGSAKPIADNSTVRGRALNGRVEVVLNEKP